MRKKILLVIVAIIITFQVGTKLYNSYKLNSENEKLLKLTQNNTSCVKLFSYECKALLYVAISSADFFYNQLVSVTQQKVVTTSKLFEPNQARSLKPYLMATVLKIPKESVEEFLQNEKGNIDLLEDAGLALIQFEISKALELKGKNSSKYSKISEDFSKNFWKKLKPELHKNIAI